MNKNPPTVCIWSEFSKTLEGVVCVIQSWSRHDWKDGDWIERNHGSPEWRDAEYEDCSVSLNANLSYLVRLKSKTQILSEPPKSVFEAGGFIRREPAEDTPVYRIAQVVITEEKAPEKP